MKLIGAYGSPYTRRVAITLRRYGLEHEMHKVTPFGDKKEMLRKINPVAKIPILQLSDGEFIAESQIILEYLDSLAPEGKRLTPPSGKERREILNYNGVASAAVDKLVSVLYEFHFRPKEMVYKPWIKMCDQQVEDGFVWLNSKLVSGRFVGDKISQADITAAVFWQFAVEKRAKFCQRMNCGNLERLSSELEQTDAFMATQPEGPLPQGLELGTRTDTGTKSSA